VGQLRYKTTKSHRVSTTRRPPSPVRERPSIILFMRAQRSRVSWSFLKASARPQNRRANIIIILYIVHCLTAAVPPSSRPRIRESGIRARPRHRSEPRPRYYTAKLVPCIIIIIIYQVCNVSLRRSGSWCRRRHRRRCRYSRCYRYIPNYYYNYYHRLHSSSIIILYVRHTTCILNIICL